MLQLKVCLRRSVFLCDLAEGDDLQDVSLRTWDLLTVSSVQAGDAAAEGLQQQRHSSSESIFIFKYCNLF